MLKKILLVLAVLILLLVVVIALQPSDFRIERSTTIAAAPVAVFPHVNDLHQWGDWSPWAKLDPAMKLTFDGEAGKGATYHWEGNSDVGEGRMTITESRPDELVRIHLEFIRPFAATNEVEFTFEPKENQTKVNWLMTGKNDFMGKAFGLFVNVEKMVGGQFEQGLSQLKSVVEKDSKSAKSE